MVVEQAQGVLLDLEVKYVYIHMYIHVHSACDRYFVPRIGLSWYVCFC